MNIDIDDNKFVEDLVKHFMAVIRNYEEDKGRMIGFNVDCDLAEGRRLTVELGLENG